MSRTLLCARHAQGPRRPGEVCAISSSPSAVSGVMRPARHIRPADALSSGEVQHHLRKISDSTTPGADSGWPVVASSHAPNVRIFTDPPLACQSTPHSFGNKLDADVRTEGELCRRTCARHDCPTSESGLLRRRARFARFVSRVIDRCYSLTIACPLVAESTTVADRRSLNDDEYMKGPLEFWFLCVCNRQYGREVCSRAVSCSRSN